MALPVSIQIKEMLISRIESLSSIQVVYPSAVINNAGWPAVSITPQAEEGEFSSNAENSRVYTFNCIVLFPVGEDFVPESERERMDYGERVIAQAMQDIITAVDTDFELDGGVVLFVNAADAEWAYYEYEGGIARAVNVTLKVYTEVTIL